MRIVSGILGALLMLLIIALVINDLKNKDIKSRLKYQLSFSIALIVTGIGIVIVDHTPPNDDVWILLVICSLFIAIAAKSAYDLSKIKRREERLKWYEPEQYENKEESP